MGWLWNLCRVHRIGQSRPVHVRKLVVRGTVEERVLSLRVARGRGIADEETEEQLAVPSLGSEESSSSIRGAAELRWLLGLGAQHQG